MKKTSTPKVWATFFGDDPQLYKRLEKLSIIKTYDAKECILTQQEKNSDVFYMLQGNASAFSLSIDGKEVWLDTITPGSLFGEVAAIGNGSRSATIVANTKSKIARFKGDDFIELINDFGFVGLAVSKLLVLRIERTTRRMCELSALSAPSRIYIELLRLAKYDENYTTKNLTIGTIPPNTKIAVMVNSTRETVSRTLSDLERKNLITRKGAKIVINDPDTLINMIN